MLSSKSAHPFFRFKRTVVNIFLGVALAMSVSVTVHSQQGSKVTINELKPKKDSSVPDGNFAAVEGSADSGGDIFAVYDLDIMQPVIVTLVAADTNDDLLLQLEKEVSSENLKEGSTAGKGQISFNFRTQGSLIMKVTSQKSEKPKPYRLAVLVGDEIPPKLPSVFVPVEKTSTGWGKVAEIFLISVMGALIIYYVAIRRRKK